MSRKHPLSWLATGLLCFGIGGSATAQEATVKPVSHMNYFSGSEATAACGTCDPCAPCACPCPPAAAADEDEAWSLSALLFGDDPPVNIGGWVQMGYHNNTTAIGNAGAFNVFPGDITLQQGWLYAQKEADGSEGWDWGFRADLMYGTDAFSTQAFGNPPGSWDFMNGFDHGIYGWAIPQLYAQVANGDLSVIAGHFYTLVGYEVVTAPDNFFYSHAFTMFNSEPFTHTGVLASYTASENLTVHAGWTLGWDTGFDQLNGGSSFLGGASAQVTEDINVTYITTFGNFGARGNGYSHSIVAVADMTESIQYIFQSDYVDGGTGDGALDSNYGINQYLIYSVNDYLGVGGRMEWWKAGGVSHYAATGGVNIKPHSNLIFRPEIRHNWAPGFMADETIFGVDGIVTF